MIEGRNDASRRFFAGEHRENLTHSAPGPLISNRRTKIWAIRVYAALV